MPQWVMVCDMCLLSGLEDRAPGHRFARVIQWSYTEESEGGMGRKLVDVASICPSVKMEDWLLTAWTYSSTVFASGLDRRACAVCRVSRGFYFYSRGVQTRTLPTYRPRCRDALELPLSR